ncbi:hypothetical protein HAX54_023371 [Datura stramonium]|uniref:Uncharacterized protein n=1 Tax=Datura stramonium TaxID=4076 RepID=A0ABS8S4W8_DATST|nr:hypothetical protein [Datura stramonium]
MSYTTYARRKNALMDGYAKEGESLSCFVCLEPGCLKLPFLKKENLGPENLKQDRKQNNIEERKATRIKPRSRLKPFSEGAGLVDGNGISDNAVKGEGEKEANSNEESF